MAVGLEQSRVRALFARVDDITGVASTLPNDDPRRHTLTAVVGQELAEAEPVRPIIAAELLGLTEKTVRAWASEGVLTVASEHPRLLLDAARLHDVLQLIRELKAAGKTKGLLDEVYRQLADAAVLERDDLQTSLKQLRRGEGRVVRDPSPVG